MIINLSFKGIKYKADPSFPLDISIPLNTGEHNPECYFAPPVQFNTIRSGDFIGSVKEGGSVNYQTLKITPHGNGTHTECYGHITSSGATINKSLVQFLFTSELISVSPVKLANGDEIITKENLLKARHHTGTEALIVRTLPNEKEKLNRKYSGTNPPYFEAEALKWLSDQGVEHLLTDLPSVDREQDQGKLLGHKAFWRLENAKPRKNATITELIFVDKTIHDGLYLLNIQIAPLETDASPSKPIIYKMVEQL